MYAGACSDVARSLSMPTGSVVDVCVVGVAATEGMMCGCVGGGLDGMDGCVYGWCMDGVWSGVVSTDL